MTEYYAHSENERDEKHPLAKHLKQTANTTEKFACNEEFKPVFKITGLLHDFGKYQPAFQTYLENGGRRGSVPHASWGAGLARKLKHNEVSFAIDGHHKGLPDRVAWKNDTEEYIRGDEPEFENIIESFLADIGIQLADLQNLAPGRIPGADPFQRELFTRYLFSALTDGDWLSTEEHFSPNKIELRTARDLPIDELLATLEEAFSRKPKTGELNQLRNVARGEVVSKAQMPPGFYSLALPTGMGKTLASLAWALRHAKHNKLKRIIIVLPYINIIDQTAQILKELFGEELILEHHSSYNEEHDHQDDINELLPVLQKRKQVACENWDYPIIVTTTVQFFESLFSNKPSKCRKNHHISESIVIFDEVQTLPKEVILPSLQMLKDVQVVMKSSFLFCTATQPAFGKRRKFDGIADIRALIESPGILYDKTRRVVYHKLDDLAPIDYDRLASEVLSRDASTLVIFNTKKTALEFYATMTATGTWEEKYHLSTSMCPFHRKDVITKIREGLATKKKILVISTQLIEAGVDFDFPVLFRAMAPLEAVIQAAGRCNREKSLARFGDVFLFKLQDSGMPDKTYAACTGFAEELIKADINQLYQHDVFERYYSHVIDLYVNPDQYSINDSRKKFNFETVNDSYRIIRTATEGLFVYHFNQESRKLLHSLRYKEYLSRSDFRRMQAFTVQVYENFIFQHSDRIETAPQGFKVWHGHYDQATGISVAPMEADKYVV